MTEDECVTRASELTNAGKFREARKTLSQGLAEHPDSGHIILHRAILERRLGRKKNMLKDAQTAFKSSDPDVALSALSIILEYSEKERPNDLVASVSSALADPRFQQAPHKVALLLRLAQAVGASGNAGDSERVLAEAHSLAKSDDYLLADVAEAYRKIHKPQSALDVLVDAARRPQPKRPVVLEYVAALEAQGMVDDALAYQKGLTLRLADKWRVFDDYGATLARHKRFDEAMTAFERANTISTNNVDVMTHIAMCANDLGDYERTISVCRQVLDLRASARIHIILGTAYGNNGEPDKALQQFDAALLLDPRNTTALRNRVAALWRLDRDEETLIAIERYKSAGGADREVEIIRISALIVVDRLDDATAALDAALAPDPNDRDYLFLRATLLEIQGDAANALKLFQRLHNDQPDNTAILESLAQLYLDERQYSSLLRLLDGAVSTLQDRAKYGCMAAIALAKLERYSDALASIEELLQTFPDDLNALANHAFILILDGQATKALESFDKALSIHGTSAELHFGRAMSLQLAGNPLKATAEFERAVELADDNTAYKLGLALAYNSLDRPSDALATLESIFLGPAKADGEHYFLRAIINFRLKDYAAVETDLTNARSRGFDEREINLLLAKLHLCNRNLLAAQEVTLLLIERNPRDAIALDLAARSLLERAEITQDNGLYYEAIHFLDQAFTFGGAAEKIGVCERYLERGYAYARVKDFERAHRDFRNALEWTNPSSMYAILARTNLHRIDRHRDGREAFPTWVSALIVTLATLLVGSAAVGAFIGKLGGGAIAALAGIGLLFVPASFLLPYINRLKLGGIELERATATVDIRLERNELIQLLQKHTFTSTVQRTSLLREGIHLYQLPETPDSSEEDANPQRKSDI